VRLLEVTLRSFNSVGYYIEMSCQLHAPTALTAGTIVQEAVCAPEVVWEWWLRDKFLPLIEPRSPTLLSYPSSRAC
jgi:hypothetical protein